jgi:hypothetical protein
VRWREVVALALLYVRCREQEGQSSIKRMDNKKEEGGIYIC